MGNKSPAQRSGRGTGLEGTPVALSINSWAWIVRDSAHVGSTRLTCLSRKWGPLVGVWSGPLGRPRLTGPPIPDALSGNRGVPTVDFFVTWCFGLLMVSLQREDRSAEAVTGANVREGT